MDQSQIKKITELVKKQNSGIIALQNNPSIDGIAAATALYLALSKMGKHISIVCSSKPTFELTGTDKIQNAFAAGGNHLVVSFPYSDGAIDKVDYNITGNSFNLIIVPTGDNAKIDPKEVKFSYTGGKIDFIITVDVPNLNSLGPLYTENQNEFQGKNIINIDRHLINNNFGTINLVNKSISSTSEMVYHVVKDLGVEMDKDIATNIYTGILAATNNFTSYSVNPATFEVSADLMKLGAVKKQLPQAKPAFGGGAPGGFGGGFGAPPASGGFGMPPAGNPGGFNSGFGGGSPFGNPQPMNQPSPFNTFGGGRAPTPGGLPPMSPGMGPAPMNDFDDFDDFDDFPPMNPSQMPAPFNQPGRMPQAQPSMQPQPSMPSQTQMPPRPPMPSPQQSQPFGQSMQRPPQPSPTQQGSAQQMPSQQPIQPQPTVQPQQNFPMPQPVPQPQQQPAQSQQPQSNGQQNDDQNGGGQQKSPQDWLKPKLFRGSKLI